jgi:voltage-gated potassium channel
MFPRYNSGTPWSSDSAYPGGSATRYYVGRVERGIVDERAERVERRLERPLLFAALLTIPAIIIEQSATREPWPTIATVLNWTIWVAFLGEIVVMLAIVPNRGRWLLRHPLEVAIVVLTPPFLPASLQAARAFRLLRLLRLVKAAALTRRLLSTEGVRDASVLALVTVLAGGAAFAAVEKVDMGGNHLSTWDGIWWAIGTVTTVGYGGPPRTDAGRAIAIVVMLVGIGFVAILTAAAADRFLRVRRQEASELRAVHDRLDEIVARLDKIG